jgi:hypothetical protein
MLYEWQCGIRNAECGMENPEQQKAEHQNDRTTEKKTKSEWFEHPKIRNAEIPVKHECEKMKITYPLKFCRSAPLFF